MNVFRKRKRGNFIGDLFERVVKGRICNKEIEKDENGLKFERIIIN